jgi:hypothetical protein
MGERRDDCRGVRFVGMFVSSLEFSFRSHVVKRMNHSGLITRGVMCSLQIAGFFANPSVQFRFMPTHRFAPW